MRHHGGAPLALQSVWARYRIREWLQYLALPFMGALEANQLAGSHLVTGTASTACLLAYAYVLNDRADRPEASITWWWVGWPALAAVTFWFFLSGPQRMAGAAFAVVVTLYSVPGPAFRMRPIVGTASNAIGSTLLLGLGLAQRPAAAFWALAVVLIWVQAAVQLIHELADQDADRVAGRRTSALQLGETRARWVACVCFWLAGVSAFLHSAGLTR